MASAAAVASRAARFVSGVISTSGGAARSMPGGARLRPANRLQGADLFWAEESLPPVGEPCPVADRGRDVAPAHVPGTAADDLRDGGGPHLVPRGQVGGLDPVAGLVAAGGVRPVLGDGGQDRGDGRGDGRDGFHGVAQVLDPAAAVVGDVLRGRRRPGIQADPDAFGLAEQVEGVLGEPRGVGGGRVRGAPEGAHEVAGLLLDELVALGDDRGLAGPAGPVEEVQEVVGAPQGGQGGGLPRGAGADGVAGGGHQEAGGCGHDGSLQWLGQGLLARARASRSMRSRRRRAPRRSLSSKRARRWWRVATRFLMRARLPETVSRAAARRRRAASSSWWWAMGPPSQRYSVRARRTARRRAWRSRRLVARLTALVTPGRR